MTATSKMLAGAAFFFLGIATADAQTLTGCLTRGGTLTKLAIGDEPARPCQGNQTQLSLPLEDGDSETRTIQFFVMLEGDGSEETIAVNDPLELFARCELSLGIGQDQVSIRAFSDIAGAQLAASSGFVPSPAPNEFLLSFGRTVNGPGTEIYTRAVEAAGSNVEGTSVLAPDGSYIGVEASTLGLGLNILDHDCIAVGTVYLDNAPLE
jgi:hypothetical protein